MATPHEIPDIAAEAAQSGGIVAREHGEAGARLDPQKLGAVLDEIETCYRVLTSAKD